MNHSLALCRKLLALLLCAAFFPSAWPAPGAHGPDGEHLDGPGGHSHAASTDAPRVQAHTEAFELVATLADGELSILIDRYETNEPVLGAQVEVVAAGRKAKAKFHVDHGDYAVDDETFLQALRQPGEHALVFTVVAGTESDLIDGVLRVDAAHADDHGHDHEHSLGGRLAAGAGAVLLLVAAAWGAMRLRRRAGAKLGTKQGVNEGGAA
jgi:hypothetical protein